MMITEALRLSSNGVAFRYDDTGHIWLYKRDKSYIMVATDVTDDTGDLMFAELECKVVEDFDNWEPYEHEQ